MAKRSGPDAITIGNRRAWLRLDDQGITVRNLQKPAEPIGWDQVRRFEDGSVLLSGDEPVHGAVWALRIVLDDGREIIADGTCCWMTFARPRTLTAVGQAAARHAVPAELTGRAPGTGPGVLTIADASRGKPHVLGLDDDGITVRNGLRTRRIGWDQVRWIRDGSDSEGDRWMLCIELTDGRIIHPLAIHRLPTDAGALAAVREAAARHAVPALLTGTPVREGEPDTAGLYADPGGKLGLREWTGTEWSPYLQLDPDSSGPEGQPGPATVWSPLPAPEQQRQWDAAAARARRSGIWFAVWLSVTAVAAAVLLAVLAYNLGEPKASLRWTGGAAFYWLIGAFVTIGILDTRNKRRKIDQAAKAAARLAQAEAGTPSTPDEQDDDGPASATPIDGQPAEPEPATGTAPASCLECGADSAHATDVCARCGAPLKPLSRS